MSIKRIWATVAVFILACGGWWVLGTAVYVRTDSLGSALGLKVEDLWGGPITQTAPNFFIKIPGSNQQRVVSPKQNKVNVKINLDQRKKGLIWYPAYKCEFKGNYSIINPDPVTQKVRVHFDFPAPNATYDGFKFSIDDQVIDFPVDTQKGVDEIIELAPGQTRQLTVSYLTRGLRQWRYQLSKNHGKIRNLDLTLQTDFQDIDFPEGTLSPSMKQLTDKGYLLTWQSKDLITTRDIGLEMPEKINPGPLVGRVTFFAPVCLLFFFVLLATIDIFCRINIHPMHYLFVASGFFAFHLLFAYMVDLMNVHLAFMISTIVTILLVTGYLKAALGEKFPWKIACAGQLIYLILFSYSFFIKGMTGLTVTIGSIITLAVLMKVTAKIEWHKVFGSKKDGKIVGEKTAGSLIS